MTSLNVTMPSEKQGKLIYGKRQVGSGVTVLSSAGGNAMFPENQRLANQRSQVERLRRAAIVATDH